MDLALEELEALLVEDLHKLGLKVLVTVPGSSGHRAVRLHVIQHVHFLLRGLGRRADEEKRREEEKRRGVEWTRRGDERRKEGGDEEWRRQGEETRRGRGDEERRRHRGEEGEE